MRVEIDVLYIEKEGRVNVVDVYMVILSQGNIRSYCYKPQLHVYQN
jgi:hypothetical protein